jgi:hypothetical protein
MPPTGFAATHARHPHTLICYMPTTQLKPTHVAAPASLPLIACICSPPPQTHTYTNTIHCSTLAYSACSNASAILEHTSCLLPVWWRTGTVSCSSRSCPRTRAGCILVGRGLLQLDIFTKNSGDERYSAHQTTRHNSKVQAFAPKNTLRLAKGGS